MKWLWRYPGGPVRSIFPTSMSLRARLLAAAVLVQAAVLGLLVAAGAGVVALAVAALVLSVACMAALAYWLTRSFSRLTAASERLAAGDLAARLPVEGGDEAAKLTRA